jgi:preprotein translocase subunit SecA
MSPCYYTAAAEKWPAIVAAIQAQHAAGRAVLAGTRTLAESECLAGLLTEAGIPHQVLNARQDAGEAELVARAGETGRVTVATNMAGRGTDIRLTPEVTACGGLHVIVCEHNDSRRVDRQLTGRCARHGEPGSYQVFGALDDACFRDIAGAMLLRCGLRLPRLRRVAATLTQYLLERRQRRARAMLLKADLARDELTAFAGNAE